MAKDSTLYNSFILDQSIPSDSLPATVVEGLYNDTNTYTITEKDSAVTGIGYDGDSLPYSLAKSDGIFVFFFLCFLLFTYMYKENFFSLKENIVQLFSLRKRPVNYGEITTKEVGFSYLLVIQTFILMSIGLYDAFIEYIPSGNSYPPLLVIASFVGLMLLFIGIKYVWYKIFGYIFDLRKSLRDLMQANLNIFEMLGIIFFIPMLLLIYLEYWHLYIICFMLLLFLISQIIFFIKIVLYFVKEKFSFLFLIAYHCTVEIIPYLLLGVGLIYLYKTHLFNVVIL